MVAPALGRTTVSVGKATGEQVHQCQVRSPVGRDAKGCITVQGMLSVGGLVTIAKEANGGDCLTMLYKRGSRDWEGRRL